MNMLTPETSFEKIHRLLPEFEAAVYDPLVNELYGELDAGTELEDARTHIARAAYCRETTEAGYKFLSTRLGSVAVQHEVHKLPDEYHHFLRIGGTSPKLTGADLIIDPTYLHYFKNARTADLTALRQQYSRVFVGTRLEVVQLMLGPEFKAQKARLYGPETWASLR